MSSLAEPVPVRSFSVSKPELPQRRERNRVAHDLSGYSCARHNARCSKLVCGFVEKFRAKGDWSIPAYSTKP
jgi:hypothetical protein